jgi:hypothetical protein
MNTALRAAAQLGDAAAVEASLDKGADTGGTSEVRACRAHCCSVLAAFHVAAC